MIRYVGSDDNDHIINELKVSDELVQQVRVRVKRISSKYKDVLA